MLCFIILVEESLALLVVFTSIKSELGVYLEAEVSLVPREALLVPRWVHLQITVRVREALRGDCACEVLHMQEDIVTVLDVDLVVLVHPFVN